MRVRGARHLLLLTSAVIALAGCADSESDIGEPNGLSATYLGTWQLISGHGPEGEIPLVNSHRITLTFEEGSATGTAACNRYGGEVTISGTSFRIRNGAMTAMACRSDVMDSESAYMAAIGTADSIARKDDMLVLSGPATTLRFELLPPVPIAKLIGTRWHLESLISGLPDEAVASSAEPAELLIRSNGSLTGSTGCRDLDGEWIEDGDEILFATFGADGHCPKKLQTQDSHVVTVLGDGFIVEIDDDRLTLSSTGGLGLTYRAS
jgi:heat shock protein HslJ